MSMPRNLMKSKTFAFAGTTLSACRFSVPKLRTSFSAIVVSVFLMSNRMPSYRISFLEMRDILDPIKGGSML